MFLSFELLLLGTAAGQVACAGFVNAETIPEEKLRHAVSGPPR
jgi:hypothetical protein